MPVIGSVTVVEGAKFKVSPSFILYCLGVKLLIKFKPIDTSAMSFFRLAFEVIAVVTWTKPLPEIVTLPFKLIPPVALTWKLFAMLFDCEAAPSFQIKQFAAEAVAELPIAIELEPDVTQLLPIENPSEELT